MSSLPSKVIKEKEMDGMKEEQGPTSSFETWVDDIFNDVYGEDEIEYEEQESKTVFVHGLSEICNRKLVPGRKFQIDLKVNTKINDVKRQIEDKFGICPEDQTILKSNKDNMDLSVWVSKHTDKCDSVLVYSHTKHVCVRVRHYQYPEILFLQFPRKDTFVNLKKMLIDIGLIEQDAKTISGDGSMNNKSVEDSDLLEALECPTTQMVEVRCGPPGIECYYSFEIKALVSKHKSQRHSTFKINPLCSIETLKDVIGERFIRNSFDEMCSGSKVYCSLKQSSFCQAPHLLKDFKVFNESMLINQDELETAIRCSQQSRKRGIDKGKDSDGERSSNRFRKCLPNRFKGDYSALVLNYAGSFFDSQLKEKIIKVTQILSVASECHPLVRKEYKDVIQFKKDIFAIYLPNDGDLTSGQLNCFRMLIGELTGDNDKFLELVQHKAWEYKYEVYRPDIKPFKILIQSFKLDSPEIQLVLRNKKSSKQYPMWNSSTTISIFRNSLPNIVMSRSDYEGHMHTNQLQNIQKIDGVGLIHYCQMEIVLPGDAIYICHSRIILGDYAHVILFVGTRKTRAEDLPSVPMFRASKSMMHCIHSKRIPARNIVLNFSLENITTIGCGTLENVIVDNNDCFVVRGSDNDMRRKEYVDRAFRLTDPPFTFDYDPKDGNCDSLLKNPPGVSYATPNT